MAHVENNKAKLAEKKKAVEEAIKKKKLIVIPLQDACTCCAK